MLEVLYRDEVVVAVHKPPGLMVHRSDLDRRETRFAVQLLRAQLGRNVFPAHRLDRGTSGVLLFEGSIDHPLRRLEDQPAPAARCSPASRWASLTLPTAGRSGSTPRSSPASPGSARSWGGSRNAERTSCGRGRSETWLVLSCERGCGNAGRPGASAPNPGGRVPPDDRGGHPR